MKSSTRVTAAGALRGRRPARQTGATMVELILLRPFAIILVMAIIQLGLMFTAKEVINEGAFLAAREGSVQNAQVSKMTGVMVKALVPFYQDTTNSNDLTRLGTAYLNAQLDTTCIPLVQCFLEVKVLNPDPASGVFDDFGVTGNPAWPNQVYIPNDNLEYRPHNVKGPSSGMSIQDANALQIKVTYGYELKVPLMKTLFKAIMCGVDSGIDAFGRQPTVSANASDCFNYYSHGRVPLVAYATVQMQSPAWKP